MENSEEIKELIEEISIELRNINKANDIIQYYWKVGALAEKLIIAALGKENCQLPINIERIAQKLNINIEEEELNAFENVNIIRRNRKIGQLVIRKELFSADKKVTIYVDKMAPPSSKRYAIANEIAHYLIYKEEDSYYENYFIMPLCPKKREEIAIDIFSIFLLIPMREFFKEFTDYVQKRVETQKIPITTEDWMRYLSERALLSEYYVAYGYQYLRAVGYLIYEVNECASEKRIEEECIGEECLMAEECSEEECVNESCIDEEYIERQDNEEELKRDIIGWSKENFTENTIKYLFQE